LNYKGQKNQSSDSILGDNVSYIKGMLICLAMMVSKSSFANMSANELVEYCKNKNLVSYDSIRCSYFIAGFSAGVVAGSLFIMRPKEQLSGSTLKNMFMKQMKEHPENGDKDVLGELMYVLIQSGKVTLRKK
jgi:hypothetical protein